MAVKSFQGARAKKTRTKTPQLLVRDIMCQNLILFHPEQSIHEVMQKFVKYRISGVQLSMTLESWWRLSLKQTV